MIEFSSPNTVAIGEAMVELAPIAEGTYRRGFAGDTFNTAWHMAQAMQGKAKVGYATRVGTDAISDSFVAQLAADGMDVSTISRDAQRGMGLYMIQLDGAERSFHYWRDTSAARGLAADAAALSAAIKGAGLIHLSGITLAILPPDDRATLLAALKGARENGARVSFDPNIRPRLWSSMDEVREVIAHMLALTDIALPSFDDEALIWADTSPKATAERFERAGVAEIAVKDGAGPVWSLSQGQMHQIATPQVSGVCDTTGAGDGFNAGYLAARLAGSSPVAAVSVGQQFSAKIIQHYGARLPKDLVQHIV